MRVELANIKLWQNQLLASPYGGPFHDFNWGNLMTKHFGGFYFPLVAKDENMTWLIPAYKGAQWSVGDDDFRVGSIGYGGPLAIHKVKDPAFEAKKILEVLDAVALYLECNQAQAVLYPSKFWPDNMDGYTTAKLYLGTDQKKVFDHILSSNVRQAIRKSIKSGIEVRLLDSTNPHEVDTAYKLVEITQKTVGSNYVTPKSLFEDLCALDMGTTSGRAFAAVLDGRIVGVTVLIYSDKEAFFLLHGWDREYALTSLNQGLLWGMMQFAIERHIPVFNMGSSHSEELLKSKLRWGAVQETVPTLKINLSGSALPR